MKIVLIHGQDHIGSTCTVARKVADQVMQAQPKGMECVLREFFLPKDFSEPCRGCYTCFQKDLSECPHFKALQPISDAILAADLLIFDSPVYVYHATGPMMSFLDHFATWWVVHRPRTEMTMKQAVVISTAAGGGMKSACRDMADSLEMWGVRKVYRFGIGVQATKPTEIPERIMGKIEKRTGRIARAIVSQNGKQGMNARAKMWFYTMRLAHRHFAPMEPDYGYWQKQGWHGSRRPWQRNDEA